MPLPAISDVAMRHLFTSTDEMTKVGIPVATQQHIIRLRDMYNHWLAFPKKKDREIVAELKHRYKLQNTQAYDDLRIIKNLLGNLQEASKQYHRYRFLEMITESYDMARTLKDTRSMVAAADKYAKYMQLDKEDEHDARYDLIPIQPFEPTDDPTVIGIKPVADIREKIRRKKEQYWNENIEDVAPELIEYNEDDIFHPSPKPSPQDGK